MRNFAKKALVTLCSSIMLIGVNVLVANATEVQVGDFTIERAKSGYSSPYVVSVKAYKGNGGEITLPTEAEINETVYPITAVGSAFEGNGKITGVIIPEGYTEIGVNAFKDCTNLKSVEIPGSTDMISSSAFLGCSALEDVVFAEDTASSLTVNMGAFAGCTSLKSIELPARLDTARYNFLYGCNALTSITVKDGAQNFYAEDNVLYNVGGDEAVMVVYPGGKTETEYTLPTEINGKAVTSAAMHLFRKNAVLEKVTVPSSVTNLGGYAFNSMSAIKEIVLEHETAPTIGSEICTEMKAGSKIIVKNESVAKAFESASKWTVYYTPENTTVDIFGETPEVKTVSAAFSISAEPELVDNKAIYTLYLDKAENVNTILLKVSFDSAQVAEGTVTTANGSFTAGTSAWAEESGKLVLKAYVGMTGNVSGFSSEEKTALVQITVPLKADTTGNVTAKITDVKAAGITGEDESAMNGTVTIDTAAASVFVPNYDVNGDGTVDIIDITEAQRYYRATSSDANWESAAKVMDVNGDGTVDIQDYIEIFHNLSNF